MIRLDAAARSHLRHPPAAVLAAQQRSSTGSGSSAVGWVGLAGITFHDPDRHQWELTVTRRR